ncbi:MAG TPA: ABC transporter ATP-binding protein [Acidimicrobiales bacterium]|nr:ABC transporter ATP-binding protein [Acidimicrobiales bacterium]
MGLEPPPVFVRGLTKRLRGGVRAVESLDLTVGHGQIVGLAGPNGAGKSITLKVLLGLVRPSGGRVEIFGEPVRPGAPVLARVGALVDGPGFAPYLSGLDNLRLAWRALGLDEHDGDFEYALGIAGLGPAVHRRYRTYSHGMRYRLGLAQALIGRPDLLILDEPTTGLDPAHVLTIRQAIDDASARGCAVLLSSHQLGEVERLCTHTAVMRRGSLVVAGSVPEVIGQASVVVLDVAVPEAGRAVLAQVPGVRAVTSPEGRFGDHRLLAVEGDALRPVELLVALAEAGVEVRSFRRGRSLEEAYLTLVGGDLAVEGERTDR